MELDQLKKIWEEYDQVIEPKLSLNKELLKEVSVKKVQSFMFEYRLENYLELLINGVVGFFLVKFLFNNPGDTKLALTIVFVVTMLTLEFGWNLYKLIQADKLSYKRPLIKNLRILEKLRLYTRWEIRSLVVLIPVFSAVLIILVPRFFLGLDVIPILGSGIWYFISVSFVAGVIIASVLSIFPDQKMEKAISFLKEISQYESEA